MFKLFQKHDIFLKSSPELIIKKLRKQESVNIAYFSTLESRQKFIHIKLSDEPDNNYLILEAALKSADFILIDGYYKSKTNMLGLTFCLEKYKILTDYVVVLPPDNENQGELLIKTSEISKKLRPGKDLEEYSYQELESFYDDSYYLNDCGGYETFKINNETLDERLYVVNSLVNPQKNENILDLGCGRGELSYAMARVGADVLGIDYSADSIEIAEKNFGGRLPNLSYKKVDFFKLRRGLLFDKIVASDLVEHIDAVLFERFLEHITAHLNKDGKFILHTAPNKYIYSYKYKRDRLKAEALGLYLPENPRSFYESLMHVNEQTPGKLKRLLKKHFQYFYAWTGNLDEPLGDLIKKPVKSELVKHKSIFAVSTNSDKYTSGKIESNIRSGGNDRSIGGAVEANKFKEEIINLLMQDDLIDISGVSLDFLSGSVYNYVRKLKKNTIYTFKLKIVNNGDNILRSVGKKAVNLSYHIKDKAVNYIVYDGIRTKLPFAICPKDSVETGINIQIPDYTGAEIQLEFTMVQENVFWFENKKDGFSKNITVAIY